jgi:anti-repressor protein
MIELLKVNYDGDRPTVSGRNLHKTLEVETPYQIWFPRMCEYGFSEGNDFCTILYESTGGRPAADHQMTIDMAKEIAMIQRTEKGKQVRQYFIEVEKMWNSPDMAMARGLLAAQRMIESKDAQIAELEPKAEFYDQIMESHGCVNVDDAAKTLNIKGLGPLKLREYLRSENILMEKNIPYQRYIEAGYFRVDTRSWRPKNNDPIIYQVTMVTPKGIDYLRKRIGH